MDGLKKCQFCGDLYPKGQQKDHFRISAECKRAYQRHANAKHRQKLGNSSSDANREGEPCKGCGRYPSRYPFKYGYCRSNPECENLRSRARYNEEAQVRELCYLCGAKTNTQSQVCGTCNSQFRNFERFTARKTRVLSKYGGSCVCCGFSNFAYLSIDHVEADGKVHRQEAGTSIYACLDSEPADFSRFQVLCVACNARKSCKKSCPCGGDPEAGYRYQCEGQLSLF